VRRGKKVWGAGAGDVDEEKRILREDSKSPRLRDGKKKNGGGREEYKGMTRLSSRGKDMGV